MNETNEKSPPAQGQANSLRRRRLLRSTTAGAGILLSMQAKTALGTAVCKSPSAMISGNTSPRPGDGTVCSGGRSPGFWKQPQHFAHWGPSGLNPPTFKVAVEACMTGLGNISPCDLLTIGSTISSVFPDAPGGDKGIWEVLVWPTNYPKVTKTLTTCSASGVQDPFNGQGQLLRHLSCAYLNAGYFGTSGQDYPLTMDQVVDMWNQVKNGGTYCPKGMTCAPEKEMSAAQIIAYIEGLYDINADVANDICKKA